MKAEDVPFTQLLAGPKQFIVPVFQRDYSWTEKHCVQLWNDILRVGADPKAKAHFIGSVVSRLHRSRGQRCNRFSLAVDRWAAADDDRHASSDGASRPLAKGW